MTKIPDLTFYQKLTVGCILKYKEADELSMIIYEYDLMRDALAKPEHECSCCQMQLVAQETLNNLLLREE